MAELAPDFGKLLQNFNIKAFSLYLMTTGILNQSESDSLLQGLNSDREILACLNGIWQRSVTDVRRRALHATVRQFAKHTYNIVDLALKGSTPQRKEMYDQDFDSSSSSSSDDYPTAQYSQEHPDQDGFPGSQDTGYSSSTQSNSLLTLCSSIPEGLHVTPSRRKGSLPKRTGQLHGQSVKAVRKQKTKIVNLAGSTHYHYYNVPSSTSGLYQGHLSYPQLQCGPSPGAISPAIENFERSLQVCSKEFAVCMETSSLLPHLQAEELVTRNERDILMSTHKTREEKNQYLLSILPSKGEDAMDRFIRCLLNASEHLGHNRLATLLQDVATPKK